MPPIKISLEREGLGIIISSCYISLHPFPRSYSGRKRARIRIWHLQRLSSEDGILVTRYAKCKVLLTCFLLRQPLQPLVWLQLTDAWNCKDEPLQKIFFAPQIQNLVVLCLDFPFALLIDWSSYKFTQFWIRSWLWSMSSRFRKYESSNR